jgi:alcohol dehydrogenase (cytochrome c)
VPKNQYLWYPSIISMERGGALEIEFCNDDVVTHAVFMPHVGERQAMVLPVQKAGRLRAFDIDTGRRIWRRYPVPRPGEPGPETWENKEAWQGGGGSAWITGTYDPELDLLYRGTPNRSPDFDGSVRPGDNLYTDSVLALDPDDGSIRWHYQWTPHDVWDYSGVNENILFDRDGRKLLAHFGRNGYLFIPDRTNGRLERVTQVGDMVTWGEIAPDGRVTARLKPTREGAEICPGPAGSKEWVHAAYNPQTGLLYAPVSMTCADYRLIPQESRKAWPTGAARRAFPASRSPARSRRTTR